MRWSNDTIEIVMPKTERVVGTIPGSLIIFLAMFLPLLLGALSADFKTQWGECRTNQESGEIRCSNHFAWNGLSVVQSLGTLITTAGAAYGAWKASKPQITPTTTESKTPPME